LLALLAALHILHVSRIRVTAINSKGRNKFTDFVAVEKIIKTKTLFCFLRMSSNVGFCKRAMLTQAPYNALLLDQRRNEFIFLKHLLSLDIDI